MEDNIKGLRTIDLMWGHLDIMDLCISFNAEEGPLSPSGDGDYPSTLTLQLSREACEEASSLEVGVVFCYDVHCFAVFNVHVCATVSYSTRGAICFSYLGVKGLNYTQTTYNAKIQAS